MDIREIIKKRVIFFDGGMGTMIQRRGLEAGQQPEIYNIEHPEIIRSIHKSYVDAGADIITTNTFGANRYKLEGTGYGVEEIISQGVALARQAMGDKGWVALDIGPIGQLMEPSGSLTFEEVYETVAEQVRVGVEADVDAVIIETIADLYEMKAAVLAVKENSDLPVFTTLTYDENGRTMMGNDPITAINVLGGLGVDALGANCSLGPRELLPIVDEILKYSHIPVIVQPNAGLPQLKDGETVFDMDADEFVTHTKKMVEQGVRIIGGCCGTDPKFIKKLKEGVQDIVDRPFQSPSSKGLGISASSNTLRFPGDVKIISKGIDPKINKLIEGALLDEDYDEIISEAIEQKMSEADILSINVEVPGVDQKESLKEMVKQVQAMVNVPLWINSKSPSVVEEAVRINNGKPIIGRIGGNADLDNPILSIAAKYGTPIIGLADHQERTEEVSLDRVKIARHIMDMCLEKGIEKENILIDPMGNKVPKDKKCADEILRAIEMIKNELGVKVFLEINRGDFSDKGSQISFEDFLTGALIRGLDIVALESLDEDIIGIIKNHDRV